MIELYKLPSFEERRLDFPVHPGYIATNASVTTFRDEIFAMIHATDHWMDDRGIWLPFPPGTPEDDRRFAINRTYLAHLDANLDVQSVIPMPMPIGPDAPRPPWPFRGFEGSRLFVWRDDLHVAFATSGITPCPGDEWYMARVAPDGFRDIRRLADFGKGKNWSPEVIGEILRFHYWPGTHIYWDGLRSEVGSDPALTHWHGGSQVLPYKGGAISIVHDYDDVPDAFRRTTTHAFMRYDGHGSPAFVSEPLALAPNTQLEIVTGMAYSPDNLHVLISYGRDESDPAIPRQELAYVARFRLEELWSLVS